MIPESFNMYSKILHYVDFRVDSGFKRHNDKKHSHSEAQIRECGRVLKQWIISYK